MARRNAKARKQFQTGLVDMELSSPVPTLPEGYIPPSATLAPPTDYNDSPERAPHHTGRSTGTSISELEELKTIRDKLDSKIEEARDLLRQLRIETRSAKRILRSSPISPREQNHED